MAAGRSCEARGSFEHVVSPAAPEGGPVLPSQHPAQVCSAGFRRGSEHGRFEQAAGPRRHSLATDRAGKCCVPRQDAQDFLQRVKKTYLPIVPAMSRGVLVLRWGQCQLLPWQPRKTRTVVWHFTRSCRPPPSPDRPGTGRDGRPHGH